MWKVYIGQFGKIYEGTDKEHATDVYNHYEKMAQQKLFWQPYIRLFYDQRLIKEYLPPRHVANSTQIENTLYTLRCKT
jgi:hypothetical protein